MPASQFKISHESLSVRTSLKNLSLCNHNEKSSKVLILICFSGPLNGLT